MTKVKVAIVGQLLEALFHIGYHGLFLAEWAKDYLSSHRFLLTMGEILALAPIYTLYGRLDRYVSNIRRSQGRYDVLTYVDTSFLQMFLYGRLGALVSKSIVYLQWCQGRQEELGNEEHV